MNPQLNHARDCQPIELGWPRFTVGAAGTLRMHDTDMIPYVTLSGSVTSLNLSWSEKMSRDSATDFPSVGAQMLNAVKVPK